jgi:hypothetical protein
MQIDKLINLEVKIMSGYTQAVDNLAYHVQQMALTVPPEVESIMVNDTNIDPHTLLMALPEEHRDKWYKIDDIANTIQEIYNVTSDKLMEDVTFKMMEGIVYVPR